MVTADHVLGSMTSVSRDVLSSPSTPSPPSFQALSRSFEIFSRFRFNLKLQENDTDDLMPLTTCPSGLSVPPRHQGTFRVPSPPSLTFRVPFPPPLTFPSSFFKDLTPSRSSSDIQSSWDARRGPDIRKPAFISSWPSLGLGGVGYSGVRGSGR